MPIKTFRGRINDGSTVRIRLRTLDGKKGYRIKKLQVIGTDLTGRTQESVVRIFSVAGEDATSGNVDFDNQTLLGVCFYEQAASSSYFGDQVVVFDGVTFNQDIYITHIEASSQQDVNFYLEVEQISLDDVEATAVILKNFRNTNTV